MIQNTSKLILVSIFLCSVLADTQYSVIVNSADTDTGIIINDRIYVMSPSAESGILFRVNAPSNAPYSYAKLEKGTTNIIERENFNRPAVSTEQTVNEFFNRNWNTKEVSNFNSIPAITKNFNRRNDDKLHPRNEIATFHIQAAQTDLDKIHDNYLQEIEIKANVTHISTKYAQTFTNVKFELGGRSSRLYTKPSYNIKLNKKSGVFLGGYKKLKLRSTVSDPSYMREYLATEMLNAANQASSRSSYVRVFLNERAVGLYSLMEKYDDAWLTNEYSGNSDVKKYSNGVLYEGEGGADDRKRADLSYKGDDPSAYSTSAYAVSEKAAVGKSDFSDLVSFTKFIHDQLELQNANSNNSTLLNSTKLKWEQQLDVEGFLTCMAFEFIHGYFDGYLQNTNNYFLYKSPEQNRLIYIPWDFDFVMGNGPVSMEEISVGSYRNFKGVNIRPLMVALLNVPEYRALFEDHLQLIVDRLYNPTYSSPVIDSVANLIQEDVAWDKTLPHVRKGLEYVPLSPVNLLHDDTTGPNLGQPITVDYLTAANFILRVNSDIPFQKAVDGNTGFPSVYGVKEWISHKLDNIRRNTTVDDSLLGNILSTFDLTKLV